MNFSRISAKVDDPKVGQGTTGPTGSNLSDPNHNSLLEFLEQPLLARSADDFHADALSLFDDLELEKPKGIGDDLVDFIEEKSAITPMLAAVAPANMMMPTSVMPNNPQATPPMINQTERRRTEATTLLKSLSVPDPLLGQLVSESLTGFIFVVDAQGRVEFVSDSSSEQVGHSPEQIRGNQIYSFLHPSDHSRFGCHLVHQQAPPTSNTDPDKARRNFTCRFKLLHPVNTAGNGSGVSSNTANTTTNSAEGYITLYVACITVRRKQEKAETSRLLCVARKLSDVSPHPLTMVASASPASVISANNNAVITNATDLFTTKLHPTTFKVMLADTSPAATNSRLRASIAAKTVSMVGKCFLDFCHPDDRDVVRNHFSSTLREQQHISSVYRMTGLVGNNNGSIHQRLSNVLHVQTKSRYHKAVNHSGSGGINSGFIVSIHSIVGEVPNMGPRGSSSTAAASAAAAAAGAAAAASVSTNYLMTSAAASAITGEQPITGVAVGGRPTSVPTTALVMMSSAVPHQPGVGHHSVVPKVSSTLSTLLSSVSATSGSSSGSKVKTVAVSASTPSSSSSPSPNSENSEEAKNQLLKQLLNTNYQQHSSGNSSGSGSSTSVELNKLGGGLDPSRISVQRLISQEGVGGLSSKYSSLKRPASEPLDKVGAPSAKSLSVVCSENPSLTELLEKPPHSSITVPPPVPTKWHQEPREKLPKDIMRKFLPPHPAERAAAAAAAAAAATAGGSGGVTTKTATASGVASTVMTTNSALYHVLTSRSHGRSGLQQQVYSTNSGNSGTSTSASTSTSMMFNDDKDEVLSDILDGLIDFQERSPTVSNTTGSSSMSAAASNNPQVIAASRADERRISDIERFLASSEHSLLQQQVLQQHQQQHKQQQNNKPKMSSLAASAPSLTSILSAPPLALTGRPPPPPNGNGSQQHSSTTSSSSTSTKSLAMTSRMTVTTTASGGATIAGSSSGGGGGGNPVNLVPRMNELLQQVPPNVSIPDTPDLDSLILLQERRRRMSSGGTSVSSVPTSATSPRPQQPPVSVSGPQGRFQPPQQLQVVQNPQQPPPPQNRGQLLMQQLTSGSTTVSRSSLTSGSGTISSMSSTIPSVTRSISYNIEQQQQPNNQFSNGNNSAVTVSAVPQVLARRSSFSGGLPQLPNNPIATSGSGGPQPPMISPPPGASAAAAAVAAAAAASTANTAHHRPTPQRHASGGTTVHHVLRGNPATSGNTNRRLSDSLEIGVSDEKQRSLLQQLLSE